METMHASRYHPARLFLLPSIRPSAFAFCVFFVATVGVVTLGRFSLLIQYTLARFQYIKKWFFNKTAPRFVLQDVNFEETLNTLKYANRYERTKW
jgi:hypothetical protein